MSDIQPLPLFTSRSAIETRHKCLRERYLGYDAPIIEGGKPTGIVRQGSKYEARFGQILHTTMAATLMAGKLHEDVLVEQMDALESVVHDCFGDLEPEILEYTAKEQRTLLQSLVTHWCHLHLEKLLNEYEVISVEVEQDILFKPEDYLTTAVIKAYGGLRPIKLGFRADAVLKRKADGVIIILDFKTTKYASEDWAINLDGSLQSNLYIAAAEQHLGQYVSGIMYAGMVKGKREMDSALSSPYKGRVIQYGSYLYGWKAKDGQVYKDYVKGRTREYLGFRTLDDIRELGWATPQAFFPITIPWRPIGIDTVVGQQIIAENEYAKKVATVSADREMVDVVMEQSFGSCFKYGSKYACQFKVLCHDGMHPAEIGNHFEPRVDHHGEEA